MYITQYIILIYIYIIYIYIICDITYCMFYLVCYIGKGYTPGCCKHLSTYHTHLRYVEYPHPTRPQVVVSTFYITPIVIRFETAVCCVIDKHISHSTFTPCDRPHDRPCCGHPPQSKTG